MPERYRNIRKQIWADKEFAKMLEQMKARMILNGIPVSNVGQVTKEIMECPSFKDIEKEVLEKDRLFSVRLKIKLDKKVFG